MRNLSRGGFMAEMEAPPIRRGLVVRTTLTAPPPGVPMPPLFAQTVSAEPIDGKPGMVSVHARFLGLTTGEQLAIDRLLDAVSGAVADLPTLLRTLDKLDAAALRDAAATGAWAGVHLPLLTELEREAVSAAVWSKSRHLTTVAVARCRSSMIAALLDAHPALAKLAAPRFPTWRTEIRTACDIVRDDLTRATAAPADPAHLRQLRDLQARTTAAAAHLDRVAAANHLAK